MKIKLNQKLLNTDWESPIDDDGKGPLTLKDVLVAASLTPYQNEDEASKTKRFGIFMKIIDAIKESKKDQKEVPEGEVAPEVDIFVDLIAEEIVELKKVITMYQPPLIHGQAFKMLNQ